MIAEKLPPIIVDGIKLLYPLLAVVLVTLEGKNRPGSYWGQSQKIIDSKVLYYIASLELKNVITYKNLLTFQSTTKPAQFTSIHLLVFFLLTLQLISFYRVYEPFLIYPRGSCCVTGKLLGTSSPLTLRCSCQSLFQHKFETVDKDCFITESQRFLQLTVLPQVSDIRVV